MTSSIEKRPSEHVVCACRLPFSPDIREMPGTGPQETDAGPVSTTAGAAGSVTRRCPTWECAWFLFIMSYPGDVHAVKNERPSTWPERGTNEHQAQAAIPSEWPISR